VLTLESELPQEHTPRLLGPSAPRLLSPSDNWEGLAAQLAEGRRLALIILRIINKSGNRYLKGAGDGPCTSPDQPNSACCERRGRESSERPRMEKELDDGTLE